ncbi:hypothetical protein [Blastococcus sp. SYSU DS1021]
MLDARESSRPVRADRWRWPVRTLAVLAVVCWAASYSWLLGWTPPTRWLHPTASPWLVMELAAVAAGAAAVVGGAVLAGRGSPAGRRTGVRSAWLGGLALLATAAGLAVAV